MSRPRIDVLDVEGHPVPHADYPHSGDGDLYDCPACETIMAEAELAFNDGYAEWFAENDYGDCALCESGTPHHPDNCV